MESSTSSVPPPPKRHKLPFHPPPHFSPPIAITTTPPPPHNHHHLADPFNFNNTHQPTPLASTPFSTSSLCSSNNPQGINPCGSGEARLRDLARDEPQGCLSLSLSSDRPRRITLDSPVKEHEVWRSSAVPLGPFTGYATILSRSRFLKPAQDLLGELCSVDSLLFKRNSFHGFCDSHGISSMDVDNIDGSKVSSLILLLEEVFKRYKQYYQHLQSVVASFETVSGLGNAAPYVSFALRTMAQQFSCLKETVIERAWIAKEALGYGSFNNVTLGCREPPQSCDSQKPVQTFPSLQHPIWRSQRGLPAYAVTVFKNWLFEHFLHPYPSDTDKNLLAQRTGLSRNQVSNWFINARVRLWKPLVEEIHTLDEQQGQPALKFDLKTSNGRTRHQPSDTLPFERSAQDVTIQMSLGKQCQDRFNPSCSDSSTDKCFTYASKNASKDGRMDENIDISLALGLQQEKMG